MKKIYLLSLLLFTVSIYSFAQAPTLVWAKGFGSIYRDAGTAVVTDASGNVYSSGYFKGTVDFDPGPGTFYITSVGSGFNACIIKLNGSGNFVWAKSVGGESIARWIGLDASGNIYIPGVFYGLADFDPGPGIFNLNTGSPGDADPFILKLDAAGNFIWAKHVGGPLFDDTRALVVNSTGVYVTGFFQGSANLYSGGSYVVTSGGGVNNFILKLDLGGNFVWAKIFEGSSDNFAVDIAVDNSGNVYTAGFFKGTVDFDPGPSSFTLPSFGDEDIFVCKLDAAGNFAWAKKMGGPGQDAAFSIALDGAGNIYTAGVYHASGDFDPSVANVFNMTSAGDGDMFVSKLDNAGNFIWAKSVGGTGYDRIGSLVVDAAGNSYMGAEFSNTTDFNPGAGVFNLTSAGSTDLAVFKLNPSGIFEWAERMGSNGMEEPICIYMASNDIYLTGTFQSTADFDPGPGAYNLSCNGTEDIFVVKLTQPPSAIFYRDADADGYGNPNNSIQAYSTPAGYVNNNTDCNDNNAAVHPGAVEVCNGIDDDCDGQIDEGVQLTLWYRDNDGDGFGNPNSVQLSCSQPSGYASNNGDCNDNNAAVHPGATEVCNGIDDDCDGDIDEGVSITFYRDLDNDGYGSSAGGTIQACSTPSGYVNNNTDCNDNSAAIHPGATEVCNGIDDDCDGQTDEGFTLTTWYRDADGDTYGNVTISLQGCSAPTGYVASSTDCNDNNAAIHPGATEICNSIDDDCDGQIDEGVSSTNYYQDSDGDGYGNAAVSVQTCSPPAGYVTNNTDCNDNNAAVHPGAIEICNGIDDDCDGQIDEGVSSTTYYQDTDGDGYGNAAVSVQTCSPPVGYVTANGDCNDNNVAIHPGAVEICNNIDDDCDGQIDENVQLTNYYRDADGDGYGNPAISIQNCAPVAGYVTNANDCNDNNAAIHPGATEVCNGIDDDCDGLIDEGVQPTTYYQDTDGDGYGNPAVSLQNCTLPAGYVTNGGDCNDNDAAIHPGAAEVCNGIDDDCDGQIDEDCPEIALIYKLEYFFDVDPGVGNGISIVLSQPVDDVDDFFNFDISSVSNGLHIIYVRAQYGSGKWSLNYSTSFIKTDGAGGPLAIKALEYFYDTDPGIGHGTAITLSETISNTDSTFRFDVASLGNGIHTIYVRSLDVFGMWSLTYSSSFLKTNGTDGPLTITRIEYFVDTDPGYGNGVNLTIQPGNVIDSTFHIPVPADSVLHYVAVRALDSRGQWSLLYADTARNIPSTEGSICLGGNISFDSKMSGTAYQWQLDTGNGFTDIANGGVYNGVNSSVLAISNAPTSMSSYFYRCVVNGSSYSEIFVLKFGASWEGAISNAWENPANWSCNIVPDANTDVTVNGGKANYPQVNSNVTIRSLKTNTGSSVNVNSGFTLTILK